MRLYTGTSQITAPQILVTHFEYTIRRRGLLDDVAATFGKGLDESLSPEHLALLERGEQQFPEDLALVECMQKVQMRPRLEGI